MRVRRADAELVLAELLELAPAASRRSTSTRDTVEYAVYGAPGELPELPDLRAAAGAALVEVSDHARSPTTGPSAGASSTGRWCSATA